MNDDDASLQFTSGKSPMYVSGTWNLGNFSANIKDFKWGQFVIPTPKYSVGSTGNLWSSRRAPRTPNSPRSSSASCVGEKYQTEQANGGVSFAADAPRSPTRWASSLGRVRRDRRQAGPRLLSRLAGAGLL